MRTTDDTNADDRGAECNDRLGRLLDEWAFAAGTCFVRRDDGMRAHQVTYGSVRREYLLQLMRAVQAAERLHQKAKVRWHLAHTTMSVYSTQAECKAARDALQRLLDDEA